MSTMAGCNLLVPLGWQILIQKNIGPMHAHRNMWQKMWPKHGFCGLSHVMEIVHKTSICFDKLLHVHPKGEIVFDNLQHKDISGETNSQFMREKNTFF